MAKTISLIDAEINTFLVDMKNKKVVINYSEIDADGKAWINNEVTFWVTMPPPPIHHDENDAVTVMPQPDNYFQLPPTYATQQAAIVAAALAAIKAKFLV